VARNLGEKVTVIGLSINATVAGWLAQNRPDVDQAVLLAPFLAPRGVPGAALAPLSRLIHRLPNRFLWWDPVKKAAGGGENAYPRFPTHAIAQVLRISSEVLDQAERSGPACGGVLTVTTAADETVNNELTTELLRHWERHAPGKVRRYEFPAELGVGHDFIDPSQPYAKVETVYPKLLELID
jgi:pimeloyl-ACP methyl ester carboxylesterase